MAVSLDNIRDLILPGLKNAALSRSFAYTKEFAAAEVFNSAFDSASILPAISLPAAVAVGVAAAIIQNPEVTRRGLFYRELDI